MAFWGKLAADPVPAPTAATTAGADGATKPAAGDTSLPDPTLRAGLLTAALFILAIALAIVLNAAKATADEFNPASAGNANFALFAGFYVAAQVIERIMEFVAPVLPPGDPKAWLRKALRKRDDVAKLLADDAAVAAQIKADRAKLALGVAAVLGVLASCLLGLFFLKAIGMHVSHTVDSILTGITIAAGTKPLHDLITNLQNKSSPTTKTTTA
jgi:hypothetical protein